MSDIENRITDYLFSGGMSNPELAIHDRVRDLLIDCRDEIARLRDEVERLRLTDAEREAVEWAIEVDESLAQCSGAGTGGEPSRHAVALRALLARHGGER